MRGNIIKSDKSSIRIMLEKLQLYDIKRYRHEYSQRPEVKRRRRERYKLIRDEYNRRRRERYRRKRLEQIQIWR